MRLERPARKPRRIARKCARFFLRSSIWPDGFHLAMAWRRPKLERRFSFGAALLRVDVRACRCSGATHRVSSGHHERAACRAVQAAVGLCNHPCAKGEGIFRGEAACQRSAPCSHVFSSLLCSVKCRGLKCKRQVTLRFEPAARGANGAWHVACIDSSHKSRSKDSPNG
jgi:hypothetical protein